MFIVYVLQSEKNRRLYIGHTNNLPRRMAEHFSGQNPSTRSKGPYRLLYTEVFSSRVEAVRRELFFKTGRGRDDLQRIVGF